MFLICREFYDLLCQKLFNEEYALFSRCSNGLFRPNRHSSVNPNHLQYFVFAGKICAKAISESKIC